MANIGTLTVVIDGQTFKLKKKLKEAENQVTKFSKKGTSGFKKFRQSVLSARSSVIALGAVTALLGKRILGNAVKEAGNFEESLGKINSLLGDSELVFGEFSSGIVGLSKEFGRSKEDLAAGLKDIIDATIPASEAMEVLRESTKLSVGGFTDVNTATSAVISTFQLYRNELKDVGDAADFLFATQIRGRLTLEDLAKNIGTVIGTAKTAGVALEDFGVGFTAISRVAGSASKTATQFRALIDVFTKKQPIEATTLAMKEFGVSLNSSAIANGKLIETVLKFQKGSPDQLRTIFRRSRAFKAAAAILLQHGKISEDFRKILEREGLNTEKAAEAQELFNQKMRVFKQEIAEVALKIGNALLPSVISLTDQLIQIKELGVGGLIPKFLLDSVPDILKLDGIVTALKNVQLPATGGRNFEALTKAGEFFKTGGNMGSGDSPMASREEGQKAFDALKAKRDANLAQEKSFATARERIVLNSSEFAIHQFDKEIVKFKRLADEGIIDQKRFAEFREKGMQQIRLKNNQTFQTMASAAKSFGDDFTDTMTDLVHGSEITFGNILESFSRMLVSMAIKIRVVQPLLNSVFGAAAGGGAVGGGLLGNLFTKSNAPTGGMIGPPTPKKGLFGLGFMGLADGGVVKAKSGGGLYNIGEAGKDEAVIPLDRFKDLGGGSNVTVNVIGAPAGTKTEEQDDGAGGKSVNVILDEQVAKNIRPGTKTFQKLTSTFTSMNTKLTGR